MQMNRRVFLVANLVLAVGLSGSATQTQETGVAAGIPTAKLATTMRLLNTAQVGYEVENHRFASQDELVTFLRQKNWLEKSPLNLENPAPYQVQVTTDPSGTHYQISIRRPADLDDKSTWCRTAAFSDEGGVIYLGQAIDCPAAVRPKHLFDPYFDHGSGTPNQSPRRSTSRSGSELSRVRTEL